MGRIKGHYEWDDDKLTPGQKKEGGLHQNLFDSHGDLKGSARFIPDDGSSGEPLIVTETVYVSVDERRAGEEKDELQRAIAALVVQLIGVGIVKGKPLAEEWWRSTARPAIDAKREALRARRSRRRVAKGSPVSEKPLQHPSQEIGEASATNRASMSKAEAQARLLAALAARAYSDEQMRLVTNSNIVDYAEPADPQALLASLPPDQVKGLVEEMVTNPLLLADYNLANLASILGQSSLAAGDPIRRAR